jgi:hypothetical protein
MSMKKQASKGAGELEDKEKSGWYPGKFIGMKRKEEDDEPTSGALTSFMGKFSAEQRDDLSGRNCRCVNVLRLFLTLLRVVYDAL